MVSPTQTYGRMIEYGLRKANLRNRHLFLQSLAASMWVAVYGHASAYLVSFFFNAGGQVGKGLAKLIFGLLFSPALFAIAVTGAELFTGNTATMMMCLLSKRATGIQALRVWSISFVGNLLGALAGAWVSEATGVFRQEPQRSFLYALAIGKLNFEFFSVFWLGVGCNLLVCLGVWSSAASDSVVDKVTGMYFPVVVFCAGGMEHIIANMYTLSLGYFSGFATMSRIIIRNWIPVFLGNCAAGFGFTALVWWYNFHPPSGLPDKQKMSGFGWDIPQDLNSDRTPLLPHTTDNEDLLNKC